MHAFLSHLVAGSLCWFLASSLWIYPHSLSYFNESIGGPLNGPKHLLGSNVDWGQDLLYLLRITACHKTPIHLAVYSITNPQFLGFQSALSLCDTNEIRWTRSTASTIHDSTETSTCAVGTSLVFGFPWTASDGIGQEGEISTELREWFRSSPPELYCGYSIYIYRFVRFR